MTQQPDGISFIGAVLGGVLVSFSPCVYPLIPITLGIIGIDKNTSKLRGFILSLIYVFGIAITYSALGLFASLSGKIFGMVSASPVSNAIVGAACIIFGLSVLEVFNIPMPGFFPKLSAPGKSIWSIFFLGVISGLVIGPCTGPVLGAILVYVAKRQNVFYGASLLFVFAYAQGLILILAGTFAGFLAGIPKSGKWLLITKKIPGVILIIAGIIFLLKSWGIIL